MDISFGLIVVGSILEFLGFFNFIRVLKKLKGKVVIRRRRQNDNVLDVQEKGLIKQNFIWAVFILIGAMLQFVASILSHLNQK